MSFHKILSPIPAKKTVESGKGGKIRKLETSFKNVNFEKDGLISSPNARIEEHSIGESLLDTICVNHSSKPVVRRAYTEVQEIETVSYRSLCI